MLFYQNLELNAQKKLGNYYFFKINYYTYNNTNYLLFFFLIYRNSTAKRWLNKMGFVFKQYHKGVYYDGHERPDVVEYRQQFLTQMVE